LKLRYDEPLSNLAFKVNSRRYSMAALAAANYDFAPRKVRQRRLKPVFAST
jgi:hypothetical protein